MDDLTSTTCVEYNSIIQRVIKSSLHPKIQENYEKPGFDSIQAKSLGFHLAIKVYFSSKNPETKFSISQTFQRDKTADKVLLKNTYLTLAAA